MMTEPRQAVADDSDTRERKLDVICLGRAMVDFYGDQVGSRLQDVSGYSRYLGGSSCNIAFGSARLGLKSAMLTRVGGEQMGDFVREELARAGVDVSHVITDPDRFTGLVVLGIKDRETFPLIFFRHDCADMAIEPADFSAEFIASSRALLITGTHFSTEGTYAASLQAIEYARAAGTKVIVDIDYRPVLWGLTGLGDGETRYIDSERVTSHLQTIWPHCDLIVGTEEEVQIAGGSTDVIEALRAIRSLSDATIVLKLGPRGCSVFDGPIPDSLDAIDVFAGPKIEVLNVLGAGDAFMAGFLRGWIRGEDAESCARYANTCGALVVSRHGCSPATPTMEELDYYIARADEIERPDVDVELNYLHRVTTRRPPVWPEIHCLAFDHRAQLVAAAQQAGADLSRIHELKQLILQAVKTVANRAADSGQAGVIIDDTWGQDALNEATGRNWWIARPVEVPGSRPLELEGGRSIGDRLRSWPLEHVVKCLVYYGPDDDRALRLQQERQVRELYDACCVSGHELLLEVLTPSGSPAGQDAIPDVIERFYNLNIRPDWWKLPAMERTSWKAIDALVKERAPHCRGALVLGLGAPAEELKSGFEACAGIDVCKGFAVGRTVFSEPAKRWFAGNADDKSFVSEVAENYSNLIDDWRASRS